MPGSSLSRHLESGVDPGNEVGLDRAQKRVDMRNMVLSSGYGFSRISRNPTCSGTRLHYRLLEIETAESLPFLK